MIIGRYQQKRFDYISIIKFNVYIGVYQIGTVECAHLANVFSLQ